MNIPDNVLFLDIETLTEDAQAGMDPTRAPDWTEPTQESFMADWVREPTRKTCPRNYKDETKIATWESAESARYSGAVRDAHLEAYAAVDAAREKARLQWAKGSLSPMTGRVACISYAFGEGVVGVIECAEDERLGLQTLTNVVHLADSIVGHNILGFDAEYLWKRALKHRLPKLAKMMRQSKPWDGYLLDTMRMFGPGYREYTSLDALCAFLDIERAPSEIDGSGVHAAYLSGQWAKVVEHADADIVDLREVYRRLAEAM